MVDINVDNRRRTEESDDERNDGANPGAAQRQAENIAAKVGFSSAVIIADQWLGTLIDPHHRHQHQLTEVGNHRIDDYALAAGNRKECAVKDEDAKPDGELGYAVRNGPQPVAANGPEQR